MSLCSQVAHKSTYNNTHDVDGAVTKERVTMHVQGISHWAPANIGPYSQAVKVSFSVYYHKTHIVSFIKKGCFYVSFFELQFEV